MGKNMGIFHQWMTFYTLDLTDKKKLVDGWTDDVYRLIKVAALQLILLYVAN